MDRFTWVHDWYVHLLLYSENFVLIRGVSGLTAFLILRMWFGKAVDDFNSSVQQLGSSAPEIAASIGNGFTSKRE